MADLTRKRILAWTALLFFCVTTSVFILVVPKFAEVFQQVRVPLPRLTLRIFGISGFCGAHPVLVALVSTGVPASVHGWNERAVAIGRIIIPVLFLIMWAWILIGLFLLLTGTLESIGSRR